MVAAPPSLQRIAALVFLFALGAAQLANAHPAAHDGAFSGQLVELAKRDGKENTPHAEFVAFAILIPILVLLSGLFAGLTLGYMSLDETQLHVLSISGTP